MVALETTMLGEYPDVVVSFGDVNSTMAGAIVAAKLCMKIATQNRGLPSFDRRMPAEINRTVTDHLSDYLFVSEPSGLLNLKREGIPDDRYLLHRQHHGRLVAGHAGRREAVGHHRAPELAPGR